MLAGRMSVNVKLARWRKAQRSTGSPLPRNEVRQEIPEAFRKLEQKTTTTIKEWKWQRGIVEHPLSESQWNRGHFSMRKWESEAQKLGKTSRRFQGLTAPCWETLAGGEHVVGRWRRWIMMMNWGPCVGCMARWRQNLRSSAPSGGGVDSFLVPLEECGPIKVHVDNKGTIVLGYEKVRQSVLSQEPEMQTCG